MSDRGAQLSTTTRGEKDEFPEGGRRCERARREEKTAVVGGTRWSFDALLKRLDDDGEHGADGRALDHDSLTTKTVATGVLCGRVRGYSGGLRTTTTTKVTDDGVASGKRRHGQTTRARERSMGETRRPTARGVNGCARGDRIGRRRTRRRGTGTLDGKRGHPERQQHRNA